MTMTNPTEYYSMTISRQSYSDATDYVVLDLRSTSLINPENCHVRLEIVVQIQMVQEAKSVVM